MLDTLGVPCHHLAETLQSLKSAALTLRQHTYSMIGAPKSEKKLQTTLLGCIVQQTSRPYSHMAMEQTFPPQWFGLSQDSKVFSLFERDWNEASEGFQAEKVCAIVVSPMPSSDVSYCLSCASLSLCRAADANLDAMFADLEVLLHRNLLSRCQMPHGCVT